MAFRLQYLSLLLLVFVFCQKEAFAQNLKSTFLCNQRVGSFELQWSVVEGLQLPSENGTIKLPKKYNTLKLVVRNLDRKLQDMKQNGGTLILPVPNDNFLACETFTLKNSGTMSAALNAKYPKLVSLKGEQVGKADHTIRFDYDGKDINIAFIWNGEPYIIAPWSAGTKTYYLLYKKKDGYVSSTLLK